MIVKAKRFKGQPRLLWVDALRGFAIVLMVIFHFCYDLRYFGYVDWNVPNGPNWWPFRYLILTLFIFTVGISLSLAHGQGFKPKPFVKRLLQLLLASAVITALSLFLFPKTWIYFGILHFIFIGSLLGIPLVKFPKLALILGGLVLVGFWLDGLKSAWPYLWFSQWLPADTEDFVPLIPWMGVLCLGIGVGGCLPIRIVELPNIQCVKPVVFMGKHGLVIYLIHQPIFFSGFMLIKLIT